MAVGTYLDSNESIQGMIITETNGVWHQGVEAILPANAAPDTGPFSQIAELDLVTCISAGNCVAAGNYTDTSGNEQFMIVTETGGVWAKGAELSPPPNAGSSPELFLSQITCTSVGNCTAVGGYYDNNNNNDAFGNPRALVISETNGVWGQGVDIVLPANASPDPLKGLGGTQQAAIVAMNEVSCFRPGNCVAVGQYTDTSYNSQLMATTEIDGVWSPAIELTLPANASTAQATQIAILQGLECFKPGDCTAVGVYADIISNIQGLVINQTHGVWGQGVELIPPANAAPALGEVNPLALQCTSRGNCVAIGYYYDPDGNSLPLVVTETGGVWAQGIEPPLSANATNAQSLPGAAINSASCTGPGVCVAVGEYTDNNGNSQPMAYTTVPALSIRTANLPPATAGSYYQAWLWAAGGAGPNIWSVSAGSLPAGLTLNASTGEISGTPAASGTFSFTITVSDTGTSPGQQASAPFTIFVRAGNSG
jgi:hypothetical protein